MKNTNKILFSLITLLHIATCLRVHTPISSVTFVTPNSNASTNSTSSIIDYKYYDNLQSSSANYYYGSITKDAYDMHIKQYQLQNYESCFGQLPFATTNAQSCMKCPNEKPLFNLGTRQCQICRLNINQKCNAILNQQAALANTQPTQMNTSSNSSNTNNSNLINSYNSNYGYSNNPNTSVNNTSNSYISSNASANNTSQAANNNNQSNNNTQKSNISIGSSITKNPDNQSYPYVFQWQPKSTQQPNTTQSAQINNANNSQNLQYIQAVPLGQNNNSINFPNYTVINGPQNTNNESLNNQTVLIAGYSQPQVKFQSSQCPFTTPFYNSTTKKCESCSPGTQYISLQKKCLNFIYATDPRSKFIILNSSDQIINKNYQIQKKNPTRTIKYCAPSMPYQINGTCNQCISGSLYNATSQKCQNGCPEGQVYNQITSTCVNGTYITNPSAPTLLSPLGNFEAFKKQQQNLLSSSFIYVKCPLNNPISVNNKCTQCDITTPYYNIDSKKCENCSRGRYYDESTKNCKGDYDQGLQIYRMVPNIV